MTTWLFRGQEKIAALDPHDRGLAYGDGVFETMRIADSGLPWWPRHLARLQTSAQRLAIDLPDLQWLQAQCLALIAAHDVMHYRNGIIKLIITRGAGSRGYGMTGNEVSTVILSVYPAPAIPVAPLKLMLCEHRLADQPMLAGIKHLNRLDQVLARAQVTAAQADEGLLRDRHGKIICATAANIFIRSDDQWLTPPVDQCGIAGICRGWLLEQPINATQRELTVSDVKNAQEIFLCNAVRGILPVAELAGQALRKGDHTRKLMQQLAEQHAAFSTYFQN